MTFTSHAFYTYNKYKIHLPKLYLIILYFLFLGFMLEFRYPINKFEIALYFLIDFAITFIIYLIVNIFIKNS